MIVPSPIPYTNIPVAGVFTSDSTAYYMKINETQFVNLGSAALLTYDGHSAYTFLPTATLTLG